MRPDAANASPHEQDDMERTVVVPAPGFDDETVVQNAVTYSLYLDEAPQRRICFVQGQPQEPTTLGAEGSFVVSGRGVRAVHAFVHFDGHCVFLCSTDVDDPVRRDDGSAFTRQWTQLTVPSRLRIGACSLTFDINGRSAPAAPPRATATKQRPGNTVSAAPVTTKRARAIGVATALLALFATAVAVRGRALHVAPDPKVAPAAAHLQDEPASPRSGVASAPPAATPGIVLYPAPARAPDPLGAKGEATRERQAVDALRKGDIVRAAAHYDALSRERPENAVFEHAARILRARLGPPQVR